MELFHEYVHKYIDVKYVPCKFSCIVILLQAQYKLDVSVSSGAPEFPSLLAATTPITTLFLAFSFLPTSFLPLTLDRRFSLFFLLLVSLSQTPVMLSMTCISLNYLALARLSSLAPSAPLPSAYSSQLGPPCSSDFFSFFHFTSRHGRKLYPLKWRRSSH